MTTTPGTNKPAELPARFEKLDTLEKWWMRIGIAMLVVFVTLVVADTLRHDTKHAHGATTINPAKVTQTAPFDKPGVYKNEDGTSYTAVVIAYTFGFMPQGDLVVPYDTPVHFKVTSLDVVHGFQIPGTSNVNLEVLPGHVSEMVARFTDPGRHLILCHEYCGSGHHFMATHIRVLEKGETPEEYAAKQEDHESMKDAA